MLKLYNTLTGKKEALRLKLAKKLNVFVCGITPYDYPHIGNARTYIAFDAFVRYLRSVGYQVFYLQNVTDVDDKIIMQAKKEKRSWKTVAAKFLHAYIANMRALGIQSVSRYAKATEHIPEIISQIKRLLKKGYAYEIAGDGIYYDITKFKDYGKLSRRTSLQAEDAVSRIDESIKKRNKGDFVLWKVSKKGEPKWKSPWGEGRPGWHIEDTAITEKRFGSQYELHGGARDLIFPHHEAEIAQMEAISGKKPMAKHWMHTGFLTVEGVKMSKSLGNFITIQDFLQNHSPRLLRLLVLKTHYRSPINYSDKLLLQTKRELTRIDEFVDKLKALRSPKRDLGHADFLKGVQKRFEDALEDDFNTPKAISVLFELMNKGNIIMAKDKLSLKDAKAILIFLKEADKIFGFVFFAKTKIIIPSGIFKLAAEREEFRKAKEWLKADKLRKELSRKGWLIDDTLKGPRLKKIS